LRINDMPYISVFDMFTVGIGPSSSHTLGPWRAALSFVDHLKTLHCSDDITKVSVAFYGSLALTGKGHGTDLAVQLGLSGYDYTTIPLSYVKDAPEKIAQTKTIVLGGTREIPFDPKNDLVFHFDKSLDYHPNGMIIEASTTDGVILREEFYSIGGGFVVLLKSSIPNLAPVSIPADVPLGSSTALAWSSAQALLEHCQLPNGSRTSISQIVLEQELTLRPIEKIHESLQVIYATMLQSVYRGCVTPGVLPGGLNVTRRAAGIAASLLHGKTPKSPESLITTIREQQYQFSEVIKWIGCFAIAVNEENAAFGRVVTAPTNGSAGVIPAVLLHYLCFENRNAQQPDIEKFLLVAGAIGAIFKQGATISAAMGGCQAEIGVSSAMAAAALTECCGGSPAHAMMAAEIAMEHHLGMTCDPVGGLVQVPCIERNSMGAIKAIMASQIALASDPHKAKVSLDTVIKVMYETARDMNTKYKETSLGGLATRVSLALPEC
jgi:L-serine dehydratase